VKFEGMSDLSQHRCMVRNVLKQYILTDYFVVVSSYHGGDMEGNSIQ
jgi:stress-induced morphogen